MEVCSLVCYLEVCIGVLPGGRSVLLGGRSVLLEGVLAGQDEACKWVTIQLSHSVCASYLHSARAHSSCASSCTFPFHTLNTQQQSCTQSYLGALPPSLVKIILAALGLDLEHEMQLIS